MASATTLRNNKCRLTNIIQSLLISKSLWTESICSIRKNAVRTTNKDHSSPAPCSQGPGNRCRSHSSSQSYSRGTATSKSHDCTQSLSKSKWRESLPSIQKVSHMLKSHGMTPHFSPSDWQTIVEKSHKELHRRDYPMDKNSVLTDSFGRKHTYLRISLTERCNLRCLYCMPEEGVSLTPKPNLLTLDEVHRLARLFVSAGVTKIRLTGGEPTLRRDLVEIVQLLATIPGVQDVGLTSNGITLAKILPDLKRAGLSLLNISLDTLQPERFEKMTRRKGHHKVLESIHSAIELGFDPVKVNVVVMRGINDDEISDFVGMTKNKPINVRFIEYMPFDGNVWSSAKLVPYKEMMEAAGANFGGASALERCQDAAGEVAKNYRLAGHVGAISFVSSMTSEFCGDCNRIRLMADGNLKVCLFGANEVSLRDAMRGGAEDNDLRAVISAAVKRKKAAHAGMFELAKTKNRAMVKIGG